ncbi:hypothetical protein B0H21DRAFT_821338 [Amylocystis lapponica]|nr:hypothetical protein B0H21DRAFT_821338 [Amylocystis lapponica]
MTCTHYGIVVILPYISAVALDTYRGDLTSPFLLHNLTNLDVLQSSSAMLPNKASSSSKAVAKDVPVKGKRPASTKDAPKQTKHVVKGDVQDLDKNAVTYTPQEAAVLEREISLARLGYGKIRLSDELLVLTFGKYNDRTIDNAEVEGIIHSMQTAGVHRFGLSSMIPVLVDPARIDLRNLTNDATAGYDMPEILPSATLKGRIELEALSGQHRNMALRRMLEQIQRNIAKVESELEHASTKEKVKLKEKRAALAKELVDMQWWGYCLHDEEKVSTEARKYLSRNQYLHVYQETAEEKLVTAVRNLLKVADNKELLKENMKKACKGRTSGDSRVALIMHFPSVVQMAMQLLTFDKHFRFSPIFTQAWFTSLIDVQAGIHTWAVRRAYCAMATISDKDFEFPTLKEVKILVAQYCKLSRSERENLNPRHKTAAAFDLLDHQFQHAQMKQKNIADMSFWEDDLMENLDGLFNETLEKPLIYMCHLQGGRKAAHLAYRDAVVKEILAHQIQHAQMKQKNIADMSFWEDDLMENLDGLFNETLEKPLIYMCHLQGGRKAAHLAYRDAVVKEILAHQKRKTTAKVEIDNKYYDSVAARAYYWLTVYPQDRLAVLPLLTVSLVSQIYRLFDNVKGALMEVSRWFEPLYEYNRVATRTHVFDDATTAIQVCVENLPLRTKDKARKEAEYSNIVESIFQALWVERSGLLVDLEEKLISPEVRYLMKRVTNRQTLLKMVSKKPSVDAPDDILSDQISNREGEWKDLLQILNTAHKDNDFEDLRSREKPMGCQAMFYTNWDWRSAGKWQNKSRDVHIVTAAAVYETALVNKYRPLVIDQRISEFRTKIAGTFLQKLKKMKRHVGEEIVKVPMFSWWDDIYFESKANDEKEKKQDEVPWLELPEFDRSGEKRDWFERRAWHLGQASLESARQRQKDEEWMQSIIDSVSRNQASHGSTSAKGQFTVDHHVHLRLVALIEASFYFIFEKNTLSRSSHPHISFALNVNAHRRRSRAEAKEEGTIWEYNVEEPLLDYNYETEEEGAMTEGRPRASWPEDPEDEQEEQDVQLPSRDPTPVEPEVDLDEAVAKNPEGEYVPYAHSPKTPVVSPRKAVPRSKGKRPAQPEDSSSSSGEGSDDDDESSSSDDDESSSSDDEIPAEVFKKVPAIPRSTPVPG